MIRTTAHRRAFLGGFAAALAAPAVLRAQGALRPVRFSLDFAFQGNHMVWTTAIDEGIFARRGLDVKLDRGYGSADTTSKVAAGTYEIGFADVNGLVRFNASNPGTPLVSVYQMFERALGAVLTLKGSGIEKPNDMEGRTFGGAEGEGTRLLFPVFAKRNGVDASKIAWLSVASNLRETMLAQKRCDAITGFLSTAFFNLKAAGVPAETIVAFPYSDYGVDLYGNGLICRAEYASANQAIVRDFVAGTIEALKLVLADPKKHIAGLIKRDQLMNAELELDRNAMVVERALATKAVKAAGTGTLDPAKLRDSIAIVAESFGVANPPAPETICTEAYLPPLAERRI
jgi:NitT/TauT family transport system substrate-binding protein